VVTPFELGAFLSWKLFPLIRVSLDGRYEAAYPLSLVDEHLAFYAARPGWPEFLARYPSDLVLARRDAPIVGAMPAASWRLVYQDDVFVLLVRPGLQLPVVDRRGERLEGAFP
jgi:hypothetical protein